MAPIADMNQFVSTNDVLVSLLWRSVTRARGHAQGRLTTRLSLAVDGRQRHAGIPPSYAGNATFHACTLLDCGYLSATTLTEVALAVRNSIAMLGKREMEVTARWLNGLDDVRRIQSVASGYELLSHT